MSAVAPLIRCFCSCVAKCTDDNIYVCGRYKSAGMVCLFHLHPENLDSFHQFDLFPMPLNCEMCLATIKIQTKEYIAPCRLPSIRCDCSATATFNQSKKDNSNKSNYFFGCPKWRSPSRCDFFHWAKEFQTVRDERILRRLNSDGEISRPECVPDQDLVPKNICIICLCNRADHLITPCNHLCCCSTCGNQMKTECPVCRTPISSVQRIFFV